MCIFLYTYIEFEFIAREHVKFTCKSNYINNTVIKEGEERYRTKKKILNYIHG